MERNGKWKRMEMGRNNKRMGMINRNKKYFKVNVGKYHLQHKLSFIFIFRRLRFCPTYLIKKLKNNENCK